VLLICMVAIPMAALFGTPPQRRPVHGAPPHETRREGFEAVGVVAEPAPVVENATEPGITMATGIVSSTAPPPPPEAIDSSRQVRTLAAASRPSVVGASPSPTPSKAQYKVAPLWAPPHGSGYASPAGPRLEAAQGSTAGAIGVSVAASLDVERGVVEERLRELGANHYRLETWGRDGMYRFLCNVTVHRDSNFSRYFESTDREPIRAMRDVLAQVEAWRAATPR